MWPSLALLVAVFVADDFLYYWAHRAAHRLSLFWASHAVHHSPRRFDWFMGLRQPVTWLLTPAAAAPVLLLALGAPPAAVAFAGALRGGWHFALHTERVWRLWWPIEAAFNTPSHHRAHHASDADLIDCNFGGVLIIWDRLFGTFRAEPHDGVRLYGLVGQDKILTAWTTFCLPVAIMTEAWRGRVLLRSPGRSDR